jgi:hypothetical protein
VPNSPVLPQYASNRNNTQSVITAKIDARCLSLCLNLAGSFCHCSLWKQGAPKSEGFAILTKQFGHAEKVDRDGYRALTNGRTVAISGVHNWVVAQSALPREKW